jgi:chromosome segregation ATPase
MSDVEEMLKDMNKKFDEHISQTDVHEARLENMETQMSQLTDAVVQIARAEEKISTLVTDTKDMKADVRETKERIHELDIQVAKNTSDLGSINKFIWAVASALITVVVGGIAALSLFPQ